jgi:hypothetical protein
LARRFVLSGAGRKSRRRLLRTKRTRGGCSGDSYGPLGAWKVADFRLGSHPTGYAMTMLRRSLGSMLLLFIVAGCGGTHLDAKIAKRLEVAKASRAPAYWLGTRYDGLKLVYVESGSDAFFKSSLYYADCPWFDLNSLSLRCHRLVEIDNDVPAQGEISSMGRCIFSSSVRGVTVATFPVNPGDLRVFARGATILVSARQRSESLSAIAALRPLNGHPLEPRDVATALGTCELPPRKRPLRLSEKQRYEQRMKRSLLIESVAPVNLNAVDPVAARPKVILDEFLSAAEVEPALLRNEASRIEKIQPPAAVAAAQARLVVELRACAAVLDHVLADARRDGLDAHAWAADRRVLQPHLAAATSAITNTIRTFRASGYSIVAKPSD